MLCEALTRAGWIGSLAKLVSYLEHRLLRPEGAQVLHEVRLFHHPAMHLPLVHPQDERVNLRGADMLRSLLSTQQTHQRTQTSVTKLENP